MPHEQVQRHGLTRAQTQPIFDAFASGDVEQAIELTTPDLVEQLSFSGTPEDVVEQIRRERRADRDEPRDPRPRDPTLAVIWRGRPVEDRGVPHMKDQLQLIHDRVMPAF